MLRDPAGKNGQNEETPRIATGLLFQALDAGIMQLTMIIMMILMRIMITLIMIMKIMIIIVIITISNDMTTVTITQQQ